MTPFLLKTLAISAIVAGEGLAIYSEIYASRHLDAPWTFARMLPVMTIGGALLLIGYMLGYRAYENIWIVAAASIAAILVIEPAVAYLFFHEGPNRGATIGLVLGFAGFLASLTIE